MKIKRLFIEVKIQRDERSRSFNKYTCSFCQVKGRAATGYLWGKIVGHQAGIASTNMNYDVHPIDQGGDYSPPILRPTFRP